MCLVLWSVPGTKNAQNRLSPILRETDLMQKIAIK